jgi:hypothetical protein
MQEPPPPVEPIERVPRPLPPTPVLDKPAPADDAEERRADTLARTVADDDGAPPPFGQEPGYDATD